MGYRKAARWTAVAAAVTMAVAVAGVVQLAGSTPAAAVTGLEKVQSPAPTDSAPAKTQTAICPAGKRVVGGGGWAFDGGSGQVRLTRLEPRQDRFVARAEEPASGFAGNWWLQAYALCANATAVPGYQIVPNSTVPSSMTHQATAARCPTGKQVIGTGAGVATPAGQTGANQVGLQLSRASGPLDIARATAREDADGYTGAWQVTSYAICVNPVGAKPESKVVNDIGTFLDCPAGTQVHAVGGGGSLTDSGPVFLQVAYPFSDLKRVQVYMTGRPVGGMVAQAICAP